MKPIVLPWLHLYRSRSLSILQVSEVLSRDQWEEIKRSLHFSDNSDTSSSSNASMLRKIWPLVEHLKKCFRSVPMGPMLCINEQIVPSKGQLSLKQYLPEKPQKWGYEIFVLNLMDGVIHDFEIYSSRVEPHAGAPDPSVLTLFNDLQKSSLWTITTCSALTIGLPQSLSR